MGSSTLSHTITSVFILFNFIFFIHSTFTRVSSFPTETNPTRSGYVTVNSSFVSTLFYLFHEAQQPNTSLTETPLLFWLQGGPGCSSMLANFNGVGPWRIRVDPRSQRLSLAPNAGTWNRKFGIVFLDNPIGTGFSVASCMEEIPRNQENIAKSLYVAIKSFIDLDPLFKTRPIYLTGESYAGKYIPALAYYIAKTNRKIAESDRVNLVGFAIGNALIDPLHQLKILPKTAYHMGLISEKQRRELRLAIRPVENMIIDEEWGDATSGRNLALEILTNMTGMATLFDVERKGPYEELSLTEKLLRNTRAKKAIGANPRANFMVCNTMVEEAMKEDVMKSVRHMVEYVLAKKYKVMFYEGLRDLMNGVVTTEAWMRRMEWKWIDKFKRENREVWKVNGKLAGYVQSLKELSHVVVLGAGHFVAIDQPLNAQAMIEDWVLQTGLFGGDGMLEDA